MSALLELLSHKIRRRRRRFDWRSTQPIRALSGAVAANQRLRRGVRGFSWMKSACTEGREVKRTRSGCFDRFEVVRESEMFCV